MVRGVRSLLPRVLARVLAAVAALCLLSQAPAVAAPGDSLSAKRQKAERRGERVDDKITSTRNRLAETRKEQQHTRATLRTIDEEQTALATELARLTSRLSAAESRLREAEQALRTTQAEIDSTTTQLEATERDLDRRHRLLKARARASYMHGGVSYAEAVLDVRTLNELGTSLQYMRTLLAEDQDKVEHFETLERQHAAMLTRLDELKRVQDDARAERETQRDKVAGIVAQKREVEAQLAAREQEHKALLAELDANADRYRSAIDDLESESRAIEGRLAAIAARQRRQRSSGASGNSSGGGGSVSTRRAASGFQWPVNGVITSSYGYRMHPVLGYARLHSGTDFGAATGTPIVAAASGTVVSAGWLGGYGNATIISHGGGMATLYAHQSRLAVGSGARVSRGQVIGYVGSTGMSTGPHLHFEVRINGSTVDPARYL